MTPARQVMFVAGIVLVALPLALVLLPRPARPAAPVRPAQVEPATDKRIALTFDDVPRGAGAYYTPDQRTALLIAGLRAGGVAQAAFFLNPGRIVETTGAVERIAAYTAAGHVIANHGWSHRELARVPADAFLADVDQAEGWLRDRPGRRAWFRFPGLNQGGRDRAKRQAVLDGLAARGLAVAPVSVDGSDWNLEKLTAAALRAGTPVDEDALRDLYVETMVQSADFSDALLRRLIGRAPPQVLLLHETDLAARFIGPLVAGLRADGWTIVTADAAFADPVYRRNPDVVAANGTLPEAIALEQNAPAPWYYERNDIALARRIYAERVLHHAPKPTALAAARRVLHRCVTKLHGPRRVCLRGASAARPTGIAA